METQPFEPTSARLVPSQSLSAKYVLVRTEPPDSVLPVLLPVGLYVASNPPPLKTFVCAQVLTPLFMLNSVICSPPSPST